MTDSRLIAEAEARHLRHIGHPTHRPLADDYELQSLIGEGEFARRFGLEVDLAPKPAGDGGVDFWVPLRCNDGLVRIIGVDVKTAKIPANLPVEAGKVIPGVIYVLAGYDGQSAWLIGWEWGKVLLRAPIRDLGKGVQNHCIPRRELRSIWELLERRG